MENSRNKQFLRLKLFTSLNNLMKSCVVFHLTRDFSTFLYPAHSCCIYYLPFLISLLGYQLDPHTIAILCLNNLCVTYNSIQQYLSHAPNCISSRTCCIISHHHEKRSKYSTNNMLRDRERMRKRETEVCVYERERETTIT
jgi:hypothetical protein